MRPTTKNSSTPDLAFSACGYKDCKDDFITFRNKNRDTLRTEEYFEWRFLKRPSISRPVIVWASDSGGEKIGSLSLVPHDCSIDGRTASVGILGDISVIEQWRGRGVARRMFDYLAGLESVRNLEACVVLPNDDAARPLEKAGWKTVSKIERYVRILDVEDTLGKALKSRAVSKVVSPALNALLKLSLNAVFPVKQGGFAAAPADSFDDRFDALWDAIPKKGIALGVRNREYLNWRYAMHPLVRFKIFTLSASGRLCGYIVYRVEDKVAYVTDILSLTEDRCAERLIYYFIGHIRDNFTASSIHLRVNRSEALRLPLGKFNFLRRTDSQRFMVLPSCAQATCATLTDGSRWFLTAGDKDV